MTKTPKQRAAIKLLKSIAKHILLYGGARSGKTDIILYAMIYRACRQKSRHAILRQTFKEAKTAIGLESMPRLLERIIDDNGKPLSKSVVLNKTDWYWRFPNGSEIWLGGLDEKERSEKILGHEYSTIFFEECSEMMYDSVETAHTRLAEKSGLTLKAYYACNPPLKSHWVYQLFVKLLSPKENTALPRPEMYANMRLNPRDNEGNIADGYISDVLETLSGRKRERFLNGEFLDEREGALWNSNMISAYRVTEAPDLVRVVTGVDPSGSTTGDEVGIVSGGIDARGHLYVLLDKSLHGSPLEWGRATVAAHKDVAGDRIVGEKNYGGEMVESTIRNVDPTVPYKAVTASRGKMVRAEPIAARTEQGYVHFVGQFPDLEDELCSYTGDPGEKSPNRFDAFVWMATELMGGTINPHIFTAHDSRWPIEKRIDDHIDELYDQCSPEEKMELDQIMRESGS